jgi:hypothetical protein
MDIGQKKQLKMDNLATLVKIANSRVKIEEIEKEIYSKFHQMGGEFLGKRSGYEKKLGKKLGKEWKLENKRDYDFKFKDYEIEVKKTTSCAWFNLLRYIEPKSDDNFTLILFYKPKINKVYDFVLVESNALRQKIFEKYPKDFDFSILKNLNEYASHQLNMQVNLSRKDLKHII